MPHRNIHRVKACFWGHDQMLTMVTPLACMILGMLVLSCLAGAASSAEHTNSHHTHTAWEKVVAITEQQELLALLAANQSPGDCKTAKYLVIGEGGAGMGWDFQNHFAGLYFALLHNRTALFAAEVNPAERWRCELFSYFTSLSWPLGASHTYDCVIIGLNHKSS
jgi:hypothetical protein